MNPLGRRDGWLLLAALAAGALFFVNLQRLWPLARGELVVDAELIAAQAAPLLAEHGWPAGPATLGTRLRVDEPALDYVERTFGQARAQELLADGCPLMIHRLTDKRAGTADVATVAWHPCGRVIGWDIAVQDDAPGGTLDPATAEARALAALERLGYAGAIVTSRTATERDHRRDHRFIAERFRSRDPDLRERFELTVAGERIVRAWPTVVVPPAAAREARSLRWPSKALEAVGIAGVATLTVAAVIALLFALRREGAPLRLALVIAGALLAGQAVNGALQTGWLVERWDPLTPRLLGQGSELAVSLLDDLPLLLAIIAFLIAGDAAQRRAGIPDRAASVWMLARGRVSEPLVIAASVRGFLVGCLCGGVLTTAVLCFGAFAAHTAALQPRGFFLYPLGSAIPALSALCFFAPIAAFEELGYRFLAGSWLLGLSRRRWVAIVVPGVVYGLAHADFAFLPPADPWWARAVALSAVGCVWGWAFLRFDALTVVLSHLTADLFIFTWPIVASGSMGDRVGALAVLAVPLLPAVVGGFVARRPAQ